MLQLKALKELLRIIIPIPSARCSFKESCVKHLRKMASLHAFYNIRLEKFEN